MVASHSLISGIRVVRLELPVTIPSVGVVLEVLVLRLPTSLALVRLVVSPREVGVVPPTEIVGIGVRVVVRPIVAGYRI